MGVLVLAPRASEPKLEGSEPVDTMSRGLRVASVIRVALLLLVVGQVGRIPVLDLGERQAPLLINDLCVAAMLLAGAVSMGRARTLRLNDVGFAAIVFIGIGGLSAVAAVPRFGLTGLELVASLAYLARWTVYFALYFVVINCVRVTDVEKLWSAAETAMLIIAAFGIIQAIFLPNFAFIVHPDARDRLDWDAQGNRLVSTLLDPNVAAGMIAAVLLIQFARMSFGVRTPFWKPAILFAAMVLTLSRSGALALFVGCVVIVMTRGISRRMIRFGAVMVLLIVASLPRLLDFAAQYAKLGVTDASALTRIIIWRRTLELFLEYPWFGVGFNTYGFVQDHRGIERLGVAAYSAEGGLLFIAVMTGIVGVGVYSLMLWFIVRRCRSGWRHEAATPRDRGLFLGTAAATAAILVHTLFVNSLFTPFVMELLWLLWGLTFVAAADLRRRRLP